MATIILVIIIAVVATLFSVQNAMPVSISFAIWQFNASLAIVALLFFFAGMITGAGMLFWIRMRRRARRKRFEAEQAAERNISLE